MGHGFTGIKHKNYSSGSTKEFIQYYNGEPHGSCCFYYPNGVAAIQGQHHEGCREGIWIYRDQLNRITHKQNYRSGKLILRMVFGSSGKPKISFSGLSGKLDSILTELEKIGDEYENR